jgi:hypothetical protein
MKDDKTLVVAAVVILCLASLYVMGSNAKDLVNMALGGLFGLVTGAALPKNGGPQ